jgi:NTE family protein
MAASGRPKIGLALGSGGPRGLAHIGVIKILEKNNIPIDFIAGSSIGAMIGGFYASTKDIQEVEKIALGTDWKLALSILDPSFRQGLLGGDKAKGFIKDHLHAKNFKDFKIPFSAVATDLKNGNAVVLDEGDAVSAIRASISMPLVFKPMERGRALLADGGLSLPVPVEVVRNMGAELIIAVNLDADYFSDRASKNSTFGFYKIADNSIKILRHHLAYWNVKGADIVINPGVGDATLKQFFGDGKGLIAAGASATERVLPQLQEVIFQKQKSARKGIFGLLKK